MEKQAKVNFSEELEVARKNYQAKEEATQKKYKDNICSYLNDLLEEKRMKKKALNAISQGRSSFDLAEIEYSKSGLFTVKWFNMKKSDFQEALDEIVADSKFLNRNFEFRMRSDHWTSYNSRTKNDVIEVIIKKST